MSTEAIVGWLLNLIAAGGGGAAVAFFVFKYLGDSWIKHRLARDLELAKSEISLLAARKIKLHDHEYVVFPEVWALLNNAVDALGAAVSLMQELPDLDRMNDEKFDKWLERSDLDESEKEYLVGENNKNKAYGKILNWRALVKAHEETSNFRTYYRKQSIFIDPDIKTKLDEIDKHVYSVWVDRKVSLEDFSSQDSHKYWLDAWKDYGEKVKPAMIEIEALFQKKIFPNLDK